MSSETEFGYSLPDFLTGDELEDESWGNDMCAKVKYKKGLVSGDNGTYSFYIWMDYPNPEQRSAQNAPPFFLAVYNYDGDSVLYRDAYSEEECKRYINMILELYNEKPLCFTRVDALLFQYQEGDQFLPGPIVPNFRDAVMERVVMEIRRSFGSQGYTNVHVSELNLHDLEHLMLGR